MSYHAAAQKKYRSKKGYYQMSRQRQIGRQKRNTEHIVEYLSTHPCKRCGETDMLCLEFHHRNRKTKKMSVSAIFHGGHSIEMLVAEIKKCDVLCANCHKKEHASPIRKTVVKKFLAATRP